MIRLLFAVLICTPVTSLADDLDEIRSCLSSWKDHPFKEASPQFKTLGTRVKVMGVGDETTDAEKSDKPSLILVKPNVTVMSKSTLKLLNPNGWYCLKGKVSVLGKSEIEIDCHAKLASSNSGAVVMGSDQNDTGSVTVLGKTTVRRVGCKHD